MSRMHEALHEAWQALVQDRTCVALPRGRTSRVDLHHDDLHHEVDAALAWLSSAKPAPEPTHPFRGFGRPTPTLT